MNISYNSLSELLDVDTTNQLAAFSELFNPLKARAKLYTNPLFRNDMMSNDAIKRWSKDMLRKTKAMASMLVTPASPSEDEDASPKATTPTRSIMPPSEYCSDDDLVIEAPRIDETSPSRSVVHVSRNRSQDLPLEEKTNFFSKLFKPKKKSDAQLPYSRNPPLSNHCSRPSLEFSSDSSDSSNSNSFEDSRNFEHYSYDEGMAQESRPMLQRRSSEQNYIYKSPKQTRKVVHPVTDDFLSSEVEHAKCVWLNVNSQVVDEETVHL